LTQENPYQGLLHLKYQTQKHKNGLLVARSIVNPEMDNIPLRIINVNSEPCTLYKGTIVATCNKIREEDIQSYETVNNVAKTKSQHLLSKDRQLHAHLQNVFESGQVGLYKDQNEKFRNLLIEYSSIFIY
jgi:hypothetical protein